MDFLFDEQVIQDEKLLNLEQETHRINSQLFEINDEFEIIDDELESKHWSPRDTIGMPDCVQHTSYSGRMIPTHLASMLI